MSNSQAVIDQNGQDTGLVAAEPISTAMTQAEFEQRKNRLDRIAALDANKGVKVTSAYWDATQGETIRGIFLGIKVIQKDDGGAMKDIPSVVVDTTEGIRINGSMILVESFLQGVPVNSAVEVTCTGKKGRAKTFDVTILNEPSND